MTNNNNNNNNIINGDVLHCTHEFGIKVQNTISELDIEH